MSHYLIAVLLALVSVVLGVFLWQNRDRCTKKLKAAALVTLLTLSGTAATIILVPTEFPTSSGTETLRPDATGSKYQLEPATTTNWQKVDDTGEGDGDTTKVYTPQSTAYKTDSHEAENFDVEGAVVDNVTVYIRVRSQSASHTSTWYIVIKTSSEYTHLAGNPYTPYKLYNYTWTTNPNSSAWTVSAVNDMEIGAKGKSAQYPIKTGDYYIGYCTQIYAVVGYHLETKPPTYSDMSANSTRGNDPCETSCKAEDNTDLCGYYHSSNNTGEWTNSSFKTLSSNPAWMNETITLNNTLGGKVHCKWYFNDTSNNWNVTDILNIDIVDVVIRPNADGDYHELKPELATNYQLVDEAGDGDGDSTRVYTDQSTSFKKDLYERGNVLVPSSVTANLTLYMRVRSSSSTYKSKWKCVIRKGTSEQYGSQEMPDTSYELKSKVWATNPFGGDAEWNQSELNAFQIGVSGAAGRELPSTYYAGYCTQVYGIVAYIDTQAPTYSDAGTNATQGHEWVKFYCKLMDNVALNGSILSTNRTGNWENETWMVLGGKSAWANTTMYLEPYVGYLGYRWYFNDTSDNWGDTGIKTVFIASSRVYPCGNGTYNQLEPALTTNWQKVNDTGNGDGDTTYVYANTTSFTSDLYETENISITTTVKFTVYIQVRSTSYMSLERVYWAILMKTHGEIYTFDVGSAVLDDYQLFAFTWNENPYTDDSWTSNELKSVEIGVKGKELDPDHEGRCTQVYGLVETSQILFNELNTLIEAIDWGENIATTYLGCIVNEKTIADLESKFACSTDWVDVLTWSAILEKLGIENETKIKWALNEADMINGLPHTHNPSEFGGVDCFASSKKGVLYGYYWADKYSYLESKWNTTLAYNNYHDAWVNNGSKGFMFYHSPVLVWEIDYGPRTITCTDTMACFLTFYDKCDVTSALADAVDQWSYINTNLWYSGGTYGEPHYQYAPGSSEFLSGFEFTESMTLEKAAWLLYAKPDIANRSRLITDLINRYLTDGWHSPQWTFEDLEYFLNTHHHTTNQQRRAGDTITAWAIIHGLHDLLNPDSKTKVENMLRGFDGYLPAWNLLIAPIADSNVTMHSVYNATNGLFRSVGTFPETPEGGWNNLSTARMTCLMFILGMCPTTAMLASPVEDLDQVYKYNMLDPQLFNISLSTRQVVVSINHTGDVIFMYGHTEVTQNFSSQGIYQVTFDAQWDTVTNVERLGDLPSNRRYISNIFATPLEVGWNDVLVYSIDVEHTLGEINASIYLDNINWTVIIIDYQNGTMWELIWDQAEDEYYGDPSKSVNSTSDIIAIFCLEAGEWDHEYS